MWNPAPPDIVLENDSVHLWCANLNISIEKQKVYWNYLSEEEQARSQRFKFEKHRIHFIAARGILRILIARYLQIAPSAVHFEFGEFGKPFLTKNKKFQFNISHSEEYALFGFTLNNSIGVDIEYTLKKVDYKVIAPRFFAPNEVEKLFALPSSKQIEGFYNCWTRKEAFIKAVGNGLSLPLDQFEVTLQPEEKPRLISINWNPKEVQEWNLSSFNINGNYVGALALKGKLETINYWKF